MKKIEYSQIVRRKLQNLKAYLTSEFGSEVSKKSIKKITDAVRGLSDFEKKGILGLCQEFCVNIVGFLPRVNQAPSFFLEASSLSSNNCNISAEAWQ